MSLFNGTIDTSNTSGSINIPLSGGNNTIIDPYHFQSSHPTYPNTTVKSELSNAIAPFLIASKFSNTLISTDAELHKFIIDNTIETLRAINKLNNLKTLIIDTIIMDTTKLTTKGIIGNMPYAQYESEKRYLTSYIQAVLNESDARDINHSEKDRNKIFLELERYRAIFDYFGSNDSTNIILAISLLSHLDGV